MESKIYEKVRENPKFFELVQKRNKFAWSLAIVILSIYYIFILVIAFSPELLAIKMADGVTTVGIPVGIFIILLCFALTGVYVRRANTEFDSLEKEIKDEARFEEC